MVGSRPRSIVATNKNKNSHNAPWKNIKTYQSIFIISLIKKITNFSNKINILRNIEGHLLASITKNTEGLTAVEITAASLNWPCSFPMGTNAPEIKR